MVLDYKSYGYRSREEYLGEIAYNYGVPLDVVYELADLLGPNEDFDGLISALDDYLEK